MENIFITIPGSPAPVEVEVHLDKQGSTAYLIEIKGKVIWFSRNPDQSNRERLFLPDKIPATIELSLIDQLTNALSEHWRNEESFFISVEAAEGERVFHVSPVKDAKGTIKYLVNVDGTEVYYSGNKHMEIDGRLIVPVNTPAGIDAQLLEHIADKIAARHL